MDTGRPAAAYRTSSRPRTSHPATVRHHADAPGVRRIDQLAAISDASLARLAPSRAMAAVWTRYDEEAPGREQAAGG